MSEVIGSTQNGICRLQLNRPEQLNSLTAQLCAELQDGLVSAATDPAIRCVLLTGTGKGFCAGQDLAEVGIDSESPRDLGDILENDINPIVRLMRNLDKPVLVGVNGVAAGAGANIALAGDIVLAKKSARFIQAFRHVGLIPDAGGTWLLPRLAGTARALGMALLGEPVSAEQAEQFGLIWKAVDDESFENVLESMALQLASGPTTALGLTKRCLTASGDNNLEVQLKLEKQFQVAASQGEDYAEGVRAFLQKRRPEFSGR